MTTSTAREIEQREELPRATTFAETIGRAFVLQLERSTRVRFPSPKYRVDPVAFCHEVLGFEPWSRQVELLEAVRDHMRVAVCSGHKTGKSTSFAALALWYYCSFEDARVVMTSTTSRQVDQILWRELRMLRARSGRCIECKRADPTGLLIRRPCPHSARIEGEQGELARTGLKSDDFREVVGFTSRETEAVAGISGRNVLYLCDEASGIPDEIFEAIEGNRAGGARIVLAGNGTRNSGELYEAFNAKSAFYRTLRISSEETPNVVQGRDVVPGLAARAWIEEKQREWGENSPLYRVRVKGEHATYEEGKIFSLHAITQAEQRWHVTPDTGRLFVGLDPAGEQGTGDESAFSARRGLKHLMLRVMLGLNDDQHLVQLLTIVNELKLPRETPVVVIDREGSIGARLFGRLQAFVEQNPGRFELHSVKASARAMRQADVYDRARDELAANLSAWMRDGGAILEDAKLAGELHALEWKQDIRGRLKLTPKDVIKKLIGRSPDRYDSLALSVWEPLSLQDGAVDDSAHAIAATEHEPDQYAATVFDPYGGDAWRK